MRENKRFILTCCLLAAVTLTRLNESHYNTSVLDELPVFVGTVLAAFLFFAAFFHFFKRTDLSTTKRLLPLYFWTTSVAIVAAYARWLNQIEYAPNFMHTSSGSDFGIDGFTLKKDGRYIYWNGSGLGEFRNYGTYSQQDSSINLEPSSSRNAPGQNRLLIRPYSLSSGPAFTQKSQVFQINKVGKPVKFDSGYNIVELSIK